MKILEIVSLAVATLLAVVPTVEAEAWQYGEEVNPFTGKKDAWASIQASTTTIGGQVLEPYMRLFLSCIEGDLDVSISTGVYIGSTWTPVRYRFDEGETIVEKWAPSADGLAVFVPRKFKDFKNGMAGSDTLTMEVADFRGVAFRTMFEGLSNNRGVLDDVTAACQP